MSFADTMRIWSNINCGLASATTYLAQRQNGVPAGYAAVDLMGNLANGVARNEVAYQMQQYGNPVGNHINMYAGYGNPVSNTIGTLGLMSACSPWMFFNSYSYCYPPMPMFGGGFYSGIGMGFNPMIGMGGCCHHGFWC